MPNGPNLNLQARRNSPCNPRRSRWRKCLRKFKGVINHARTKRGFEKRRAPKLRPKAGERRSVRRTKEAILPPP